MCGQTYDAIILSKGAGFMNTYKAYKLRIYPKAEQKIMIDKTFECTRFVFNKFLSEIKAKYEESKIKLSAYEQLKEVKFRGYRTTKEIVGKIKSATISKDANKYFVSILVEVSFIKYSINPTSIVAKHLNKVPITDFLNVLKYKEDWLGKKVININKYYPSSQCCNRCEYKNEEAKDLSVRKWICLKCGFEHDRDINASINIMFEGLKIYMKGYLI